jgi:hypothetical protein
MIDSDKSRHQRELELEDFLCFSIYAMGHAFNQFVPQSSASLLSRPRAQR